MIRVLHSDHDGFTLVELLISIGILVVIIGTIFSFSIAQRKYLFLQEQLSDMVQNARASMDMMMSEITMAGYNPAGAVFSGIPYDSSKLQIYADLDGNGVLTESSENITYAYDAANKRIVRNTGNGNQPFAENIQALEFEYLDSQGNTTVATANIRQIRITIIVQSSKPDPHYTPNSGYRTYSLKSVITPRNLAY